MRRAVTKQVKEDDRRVEHAFLVGIEFLGAEPGAALELLDELGELVDTLGLAIVGRTVARVRKPRSRLLVGQGKAEEITDLARACGADVIIFDEPLSPSQQRNWERLADVAVIDRQEVILDIFASRAHTKEAALQVRLARTNYDLPRLKRRWTHLSRQRGMRGGMGLRGEGEQQIEVDSRLVKKQIAQLRSELDVVRRQRAVQRSRRLKKPVPVAAIVGYTNAGKSSLLNALTQADILVEDKLFATLDPTVRRIQLPNQQELLLTDTVGFIRKLPHTLVEAFKATLEETLMADVLIEVLDAAAGHLEDHHVTTREVLKEFGAERKPVVTVLNKIDLIEDRFVLQRLARRHSDAVLVSARTGAGLDTLLAALARHLEAALQEVTLQIPYDRYDLMDVLHRTSRIVKEKHDADGIVITAAVPASVYGVVRDFLVPNAV